MQILNKKAKKNFQQGLVKSDNKIHCNSNYIYSDTSYEWWKLGEKKVQNIHEVE